MSMYGVNAGVPRRWCATSSSMRPTLPPPPSCAGAAGHPRTTRLPELLPAKDGEISQKTEDLVGPYELHDFYLICSPLRLRPSKIFRLAKAAFAGRAEYPDEVLYKWLRNFYWRFFAQQFKRSCLPDGPKVGSVTLSPRATGGCPATQPPRSGWPSWNRSRSKDNFL